MSAARLKQKAGDLDLALDDEDLARLRPMVADLLAVARDLRRRGSRERPQQRPG